MLARSNRGVSHHVLDVSSLSYAEQLLKPYPPRQCLMEDCQPVCLKCTHLCVTRCTYSFQARESNFSTAFDIHAHRPSRQGPAIRFAPFTSTGHFPTRLPDGCAEHLTLLNDELPALVLTPAVRDRLKAFIKAANCMRRLQSIHTYHKKLVERRMDTETGELNQLEDTKGHMIAIKETFAAGRARGRCPYRKEDSDTVDAEIGKQKRGLAFRVREIRDTYVKLANERRAAWPEPAGGATLVKQRYYTRRPFSVGTGVSVATSMVQLVHRVQALDARPRLEVCAVRQSAGRP